MTLHFGLAFDTNVYKRHENPFSGDVYAGPLKFLQFFESQFGLGGAENNTEYLRIEFYRQALQQHLEQDGTAAFYAGSFGADRLATATALLRMRDELWLAGWSGVPEPEAPSRLQTLQSVEVVFQKKLNDSVGGPAAQGVPERWQVVFNMLENRKIALETLILYNEEDLLPPVFQRLLSVLKAQGVVVKYRPLLPAAPETTDLGHFQRRLLGMVSEKKNSPPDGSLLVLEAGRDSDAARVLAQVLAQNPQENLLILAPELDLALEQALLREGKPAMGVLSASLARPALQALKLAPAFLWEPVDVYKIMEFVTLPVKPLHDGLAQEIARALAQKPGLFSDTWYGAVLGKLDELNDEEVRKQYDFWFERRRYRSDATAPKRDAVALYQYLQFWARDHFEATNGKNPTLLQLSEQARRIVEMLETLPEQRIGMLELERIVRTIYQPAPIQINEAETGGLPFVHQGAAIADETESLLWWNCVYADPTPPPDVWQPSERLWLEQNNMPLQSMEAQSRLKLLQLQWPVFKCSKQLILVTPAQTDGVPALKSLLLGDVEAAFVNHKDKTFSLDSAEAKQAFNLAWPSKTRLQLRRKNEQQPLLTIRRPECLADNPYETPSNLEKLVYYPHGWFFRKKLNLYPGSLLSISTDQTLLGNLAHRFLEKLLLGNYEALGKPELFAWIDDQAPDLLEREGATLLMYGREPERNAFLNKVKNAAWSLTGHLKENGWTVLHSEYKLDGECMGMAMRGQADLVLQRGSETAIVDFKWGGATRRREMMRNEADLQLLLYAHLLREPGKPWPHTAYFILEESKMIARNREAFRQAVEAAPGVNHGEVMDRMLEVLEKTVNWRLEQVKNGQLELRNASTAPLLDALYAESLMELLEMKNEEDKYDDYRVLLREAVG